MAISLLPGVALAADTWSEDPCESNYFYKQLNDRAKAIYTKLLDEFSNDSTKANYYDGTKFIDLIGLNYDSGTINQEEVEEYKKGNKDLFNDFCAAKDALDLDHSELWYIDSGYLSFQVTQDSNKEVNGGYHVLIGPGRGPTYLLAGQTKEDISELGSGYSVESMDKDVNNKIDSIVKNALNALNTNSNAAGYSKQDKIAYLVTHVHDSITKGIHYRYETECRDNGKFAKYIRTLYGIVSYEGVCEAYARTLQVCLTKLGIECVLIHGVQSKGTPEDHMWNAVNIPDEDGQEHWYVVDATWDDPLVANYDGSRNLDYNHGEDGNETNTYLLVGQSTVGQYWNPSGYVSTGNFEFHYPEIELNSYSGATVFGNDDGLKIQYSAGGAMEDDIPAGVFAVTYKGMNAAQAREKGLYFMTKMYDYHPDGTADVMDEWYYADAVFYAAGGNPFFGDYGGSLRISSASCEYVEIAVTTREPDGRKTWGLPANSEENVFSKTNGEAGYFHGDESEIIAQSGMLYNVNSKYEAPPYVLTQYPAPNGNATAGYTYRFKVTYDDLLYHKLPTDINAANGIATVDAFEDNSVQALSQTVQVRYITEQEDLHNGRAVVPHQVVGELPFDKNHDGIVDMRAGDEAGFKWIYATDKDDKGVARVETCPNTEYHKSYGNCDVTAGCPVVGVEFNFRASDQWIDDVTQYTFIVEGLVGSRSSKFPNNFSVIAVVPGLCPACYRSQGIDWNLWGQPTLLDAPENLDLRTLAEPENDSEAAKKALEEFNKEIHRDEMNGRLMLVVENKSKGAGNREEYEKINSKITDEDGKVGGQEVVASSVFEINFNRVCPMVKLKPDLGQSLRVQVGYPAGVTYEDLVGENADVEIKAYHFTRCSEINEEEDTYKCDVLKKELEAAKTDKERADIRKAHSWGEHIVGVNTITVIPTPYGMVIMCDAFSPFEIVAVKKDTNTPKVAAETGSTLVVVSDGNGTVSVDNHDAVGTDGNVTFASADDTKTFTINPHEGYSVESVVLGGSDEPIKVEGNTFEISGIKQNDVLNVTFVPTEVKAAEAEFGEVVVAKVCQHPSDSRIITLGKEAKCTEAGTTDKIVCGDCGAVIQEAVSIPATGHTAVVEKGMEAVKATCTDAGKTAVLKCSVCSEYITSQEQNDIQALGHVFREYTETGVINCKGKEYKAVCEREGCNAEHISYDESEAKPHNFQTVVKTENATCTSNKFVTKKCKWCDQTERTEVSGTMLKHEVDKNTGICNKCNELVCKDAHQIIEIPAEPATCLGNGKTRGEQCAVCGMIITPQSEVPALGHDFPPYTHDEPVRCRRCTEMSPTKDHTPEEIAKVEPTCTTTGLEEGSRCKECHDILVAQEVIPALGHNYDINKISWVWSTDGENNATALIPCTRCEHEETIIADVTKNIIAAANCETEGKETFTATVTVNGVKYTNTSEEVTIPALGHDVKEFKPNEDASCVKLGTETGICVRCEKEVTQPRTELLPHSIIPDVKESFAPTCTADGKNVGTCAVCGHTGVEETIPALGHSFGSYRVTQEATCTENGRETSYCSHCGASSSRTVKATGHKFEEGVCTVCGEKDPNYKAEPWVNPFPDVSPEKDWFAPYLQTVTERKLIKGDENGNFNPSQTFGRGQLMTVLARLEGVDTEGGATWFQKGMDWAKEKGISDGTNPEKPLAREDFVTMLWRYMGEPEIKGELDFPDAESIDPWARMAMAWAVENGLIQGNGDGLLDPRGTADNSQAATILARFLEKFDL